MTSPSRAQSSSTSAAAVEEVAGSRNANEKIEEMSERRTPVAPEPEPLTPIAESNSPEPVDKLTSDIANNSIHNNDIDVRMSGFQTKQDCTTEYATTPTFAHTPEGETGQNLKEGVAESSSAPNLEPAPIDISQTQPSQPEQQTPADQPILLPSAILSESNITQQFLEPAIPQTPPGLDTMPRYDTDMGIAESPANALLRLHHIGDATAGMHDNELYLDAADDKFMNDLHEPQLPDQEQRITAYAKLIFTDGEFYMNTYSLILGRDVEAAERAQRRENEMIRALSEPKSGPKTPVRVKREPSHYSMSRVSESAGFFGEGEEGDSENENGAKGHKRKNSRKTKSSRSSSPRSARRKSMTQQDGPFNYQAQPQEKPVRRYAPDSMGAAPVDPASLRPSPHDCPVIGIHPAADRPAKDYKAISRQHVKIEFNLNRNMFEASVLGRNGAFVNDEYFTHGNVIPLKNGSRIQIGYIVITFVLPDDTVAPKSEDYFSTYYEEGGMDEGLDAGARYSEGGKEMSFDFENAPRHGVELRDTSEEPSGEEDNSSSERAVNSNEEEELEDDEEEEEEDEEEDDDEEGMNERIEMAATKKSIKLKNGGKEAEEDAGDTPQPAKRRGPGRPPKNGIMSKREEALLKKQAQQKAVETIVISPGASGKNKVGRPRKHPKPAEEEIKTEKRKYTKRKPKDPNAIISIEGEAKKKKATEERPERSVSPEVTEDMFSEEQKARPLLTYIGMVHEALQAHPDGLMDLPMIYRAIRRKYPFFKLRVNTTGWQSSVRHNLAAHPAFKKVRKQGKGYLWEIVPGVPVEKIRKTAPAGNRTGSPDEGGQMHPPPHMLPGHPGMMAPPPPGYMHAPMPPMPPGQQLQYYPGPPPHYGPPQHQYPYGPPPPGHAMPVGYGAPAVPAQNGTYSSPYAPKPPAPQAAGPPQQPLTGGAPPAQPAGSPPVNNSQQATRPGSGPPLPQTQYQQQPPAQRPPPNHQYPPQQGPPSHHTQHPVHGHPLPPQQQYPRNDIHIAIDVFKNALLTSLKTKTTDAEAIIASAINRVMGITTQSAVPGNPHEDKIMVALRNTLDRLPGMSRGPPQPHQLQQIQPQASQQTVHHMQAPMIAGSQAPFVSVPPGPPSAPTASASPASRASPSQGPSQGLAAGSPTTTTAGSLTPGPVDQRQPQTQPQAQATQAQSQQTKAAPSKPSMGRPTFSGQGLSRPSMGAPSRPPGAGTALSRTNSGSPAIPNGSGAVGVVLKDMSASPALTAPLVPTTIPESSLVGDNVIKTEGVGNINVNGKRSRSPDSDANFKAEEETETKRINTGVSGQVLKT